MFSVKISFKGKNFLLGKGVDCFQKMIAEVNIRFPGECQHGAIFKYLDMELNSFEQVTSIVADKQLKSIKIEVLPLPPKVKAEEEEPEGEKENIDIEKIEIPKEQYASKVEIQHLKKNEVAMEIEVMDEQLVIEAAQLNSKSQQMKKDDEIQKNALLDNLMNEQIEESQKKNEEINFENKKQQKESINKKIQKKFEEMQKVISTIKQPFVLNNLTEIKQIDVQIDRKSSSSSVEISSLEQEQLPPIDEKNQEESGKKEKNLYQSFQIFLQKILLNEEKLEQNSPIIKLIDRIVEQRLEKKINQLKQFLSKKPDEEKKQVKTMEKVEQFAEEKIKLKEDTVFEENQEQIAKNLLIDIMSEKSNKNKFFINEEFTWRFTLRVNSKKKIRSDANLIDEKTGETLPLILQKGNQQIQVGPFRTQKQGKFDKTFRLFYFNKDCQMQLFGPKFGFIVDIEKNVEKRRLISRFRLYIDSLRKKFALNRQTEYIVERLKEMGINQESFQDSKSFMEEIVQAI